MILSGANSRLSRSLTHRSIVTVGLISYSLYLVHWPLIVLWSYVYGTPSPIAIVALGIAAIGFSILNYRFVEQPWRDVSAYRRSPQAAVYLIVVFLSMVGVGAHVSTHQGWPWRTSAGMANIDLTQGAATFHRDYYGGRGYPYVGAVETTAPVDILLVGDSHARHYAEGLFKELAQPAGLALYVVAGASCFHLPGVVRTTPENDWKEICTTALENVSKTVETSEHPPLVVVSHSWVSQALRSTTADENENQKGLPIEADEIVKAIVRFKTLIGSAPLVVIGNVPTTGGHNLYDSFLRTWIARRLAGINGEAAWSHPTPQIVEFNAALARGADSTGAYLFLNPHDALCHDEMCMNLDGEGRLIYSDDSHLSLAGSRLVVRKFLPVLEAISKERTTIPSPPLYTRPQESRSAP